MEILTWDIHPQIKAGTTLRNGGVSKGPLASLNLALNVNDDPKAVLENRQRLATYLKTDLNHMVSPTQTHSTNLYCVTSKDMGRGMYSLNDAIADTDALYTREKGIYLLTYHADCTPVLLFEDQQKLIASIHAGWKGNVHEIVLKTLSHLQKFENCLPEHFYAYIGPSLSYENFEAKQDIIDLVNKMSIDATPYYTQIEPGVYHLDAKGLIKAQLLSFGVKEENITLSEHCTKGDPKNFFSYRHDHACGRHVSFIAMK